MRCPVVVGRDSELAALAAVIERAGDGVGSCVIVTGEAGVGKTRLVTEAADRARRRGRRTLIGRASPTGRESPLRPLAEALLGALRDVRPPADESLRPYLPALARLVPHWADRDEASAALAPAPLVLAEAVVRTLRWLAAGPPGTRGAVLVIEDLHWADRETLAVLTYVADHAADVPVAILLTARSDEPSTADLDAGFGHHAALRVSGLDEDGVAAMAAACLGVRDAPPDVLAATRRAGGLPLAVEDLVELRGRQGPMRYAEIVMRRLDGLQPDGRRLVEAVAVIGNETAAALAAAAAGLADEGLRRARDAAAASGLLVPAGGRLEFRHALIREVVLGGLPEGLRRRFATAAATELDALLDERDAVSARLGELWAQAGEVRRATHALLRAAFAARSEGATPTAEALLRRALDLAPADLAGRVRLELLELLALAGRVDELSGLGAAALDELAHDRDLSAAVHLLLGRAAVAAGEPRQAQPHIAAVEALGELGPHRGAQLRIVQAEAVMAGGATDRLAASRTLAAEAVTLAERAAQPELSCEALQLLATTVRSSDLTPAVDTLRRELAVAEAAGLALWRLRALNELGTVESLRDARPDRLERALELALRLGAVDTAASIATNLAAAYAMIGAIGPALTAAERGRQLAAPLGATAILGAVTAIEGVTHGFAGRRAEMERLVRRALALSPDDADLAAFAWAAGRGLSALIYEDRADALAAFRRARALATPIRTLDAAVGPLLLTRAVQGADVLDEVTAERAHSTAGARWSACWLGYAQAVGLGNAGDRAGADAAFELAERAADRYPLFRAIALRLAGEAGLVSGFGDPLRWLREAEAEFVGRGLNRAAAACRGLLARAGAPVTRRRGPDAGLPPALLRLGVTAREVEVLELVGEQLSNKAIAERLYLSPRTVEKHVASLLLKTGADDRAALIRLARHG